MIAEQKFDEMRKLDNEIDEVRRQNFNDLNTPI
jgi:hypothetical protein